jgi:RNA polymerase sigma-70 factor (ECF subfamily)
VKTDEQLVEAAQHGSDSALAELVLRYRDRLLRFLMTRCATHADAEDATQDAFVSAFRYLHTYSPRWRFSTWLYRIALRNAARLPEPPGEQGADVVDDDDPLARCIAHGERTNLWLTAKSLLAPDAFSVMWLHYAEDLPVRDVAQVLDRSLSWTKVSMHRSRRRLAEALNDQRASQHRSTNYG